MQCVYDDLFTLFVLCCDHHVKKLSSYKYCTFNDRDITLLYLLKYRFMSYFI